MWRISSVHRIKYEQCMSKELKIGTINAAATVSLSPDSFTYLDLLINCTLMISNVPSASVTGDISHTCEWLSTVSGHGTTPTSKLELALERATNICFGPLLRSPVLGGRHIDKGVYIDQFIRWFASFHHKQFFVTTIEEFQRDPKQQFDKIIRFLELSTQSTHVHQSKDHLIGAEPLVPDIDFQRSRLVKPNKLMPLLDELGPSNISLLKSFYGSYNTRLKYLMESLSIDIKHYVT